MPKSHRFVFLLQAAVVALLPLIVACSAVADPAAKAQSEQQQEEQREADLHAGLMSEHFARVLERQALRTDADAELLRLQLGPVESPPGCEQQRVTPGLGLISPAKTDDPAAERAVQDCQMALMLWRDERASAVLEAPGLEPRHLFAVLARPGTDSALEFALLDRLYSLDPQNPAVLGRQLKDPRWTPTAAELDARLFELAEAAQPFRSYLNEHGQQLLQATLSVAPSPGLLEAQKAAFRRRPNDPLADLLLPYEPEPSQLARHAAAIPAIGLYLAAVPLSEAGALVAACDPRRVERISTSRLQACRQIGQRMAEQPESMIDQRIGARIWQRALNALGEDEQPAIEAQRLSYWQMEQYGVYEFATIDEARSMDQKIESMLRGESELDYIRSLVESAGGQVSPPPGWAPDVPRWDDPYR